MILIYTKIERCVAGETSLFSIFYTNASTVFWFISKIHIIAVFCSGKNAACHATAPTHDLDGLLDISRHLNRPVVSKKFKIVTSL